MKNNSGITPIEFNVVVLPDPVEQRTKGGLILSDTTVEREKHAAQKGTLVAISDMAFNEDIWPADRPRPQPGQRVLVGRYAGAFVEGDDGQEYRVIKDKDVVALLG